MGAGKWKTTYNEHFKNVSVIIIPDNDDIGKLHSQVIAKNLCNIAKDIKIIYLKECLPSLPDKGDITDFYTILQDKATDTLIKLLNDTPRYNKDILETMYQNTKYSIQNNCLYRLVEKNDTKSFTKLANFVPYIVKELSIDDGVDSKKYFIISGKHTNGYTLPEIQINANDFSSMSWITKLWGLHCNIEPGQVTKEYIRHAIQSTVLDTKTQTIYTHLGWRRINSKWIYLDTNKAIGTEQEISVKLEGKLSRYKLIPPTSKDEIKTNIKHVLELLDETFIPNEIMIVLIGIIFLSPLNEFLKQANIEPKTIIFLIGKTGVKKSTLASLILSFFGDFSNTDLPLSFRDTANSIITQSFILKDTLTVIDDYHPSVKTEEQSMNKTAQTIMRAYGDRIGKNRLKSDSTLMLSKPPRGNVIITGESAPDISESGTARYISLELTRDSINIQKLTILQQYARDNVFTKVMYEYINFIQQVVNSINYSNFMTDLTTTFVEYRNEFTTLLSNSHIEFHARTPESLAWIYIGIHLFCNYIKSVDTTNTEFSDNLYEKSKILLTEIGLNQSKNIVQDKPSIKFLQKLSSLLNSKKIHVLPISKQEYAGADGFIGYEDDNYIYLITDVAFKYVKKLCDEQNESFCITVKTLLKHLADENYIVTDGTNNTKNLRIGKKVQRFLWIKKDKFEELVTSNF